MANYVYHRCSTEHQVYEQQKKCVQDYLLRMGIDPSSIVATVEEKVTSKTDYTERKFNELIKMCKPGDVIYTSELSRMGRTMSDIFSLVADCSKRGITLIQCKDGTQIEDRSIGGKALLFALALVCELERDNINQRTQMGMAVVKEKLRKGEKHISRAGREVTHLGNEKGYDMAKAREASIVAKRAMAQKRRTDNPAYEWVKRKVAAGWTRQRIMDEFKELHALNPETYKTFGGGTLTPGVLSKWASEIHRNFLSEKLEPITPNDTESTENTNIETDQHA